MTHVHKKILVALAINATALAILVDNDDKNSTTVPIIFGGIIIACAGISLVYGASRCIQNYCRQCLVGPANPPNPAEERLIEQIL